MSDYLQHVVAAAMGKSDILQPRLPSLFEPVLSAGLPVDLTDEMMDDGSDVGRNHESKSQRNISIPRHNPDSEMSKLPIHNPIESEIGPGHFKFEVQGRRDSVYSNDLPLQPEVEAAAALPRGRINSLVKGEKTLFINKARREKSVLESEHEPVEEAVPPGNGVGMSEYLQNLVAGELGKSDILQPRLPSLFEPILIADIPVGLTDGKIEEEPEEETKQEPEGQKHKPIPGHNPDDKRTKLPAYNPTENENGQGHFEFEAQGRRDAVHSNDLPLHPEEQAAAVSQRGRNQSVREESGRRDGIEFSLRGGVHQRHKSANEPVLFRRTESMKNQNARATSKIDHSQASEIKTKDPAFGQKRAAARTRSSQLPKQSSTEASREPSEQMPPSIKVTIGRIEVRAVTPPVKRETKKETKNPPTSLGDYLSSLRGGAR